MTKATGSYLAERFSEEELSGNYLLTAASISLEQENESLAWWLFHLTFKKFPNHPQIPEILFSLADLRQEERYLLLILKNYPDSAYTLRALNRLAWNAYESKNYSEAIRRFPVYLQTEENQQKKIKATFAFADAFQSLELWQKAVDTYQELEQLTENTETWTDVSKEEQTSIQSFSEKSVYYQIVCKTKMGEPDEAIRLCAQFINKHPHSEKSERVRFTKAKLFIETQRFNEALAELERLEGLSNHEFSEPVIYYSGLAQVEVGELGTAIQTLKNEAISEPFSAYYYNGKFLLSRACHEAGDLDQAIAALEEIQQVAVDDLFIYRASLEKGRIQTDLEEKLSSFQQVALLADPGDPDHIPLIADALFESLSVYIELARYDELFADSTRLLTEFPAFDKNNETACLREIAEKQREKLTADHADVNGSRT